eukprot:Gb_21070 [translate_table: standard]
MGFFRGLQTMMMMMLASGESWSWGNVNNTQIAYYTVSAVSVGSLLLLIFYLHLIRDDDDQRLINTSKLPPGSMGLPLVGETLQFLWALRSNKPLQFFDHRVNKYGHVFKTSLIGHPTVVLTGQSGNRLVLSNENKLVVASWPTSFMKVMGENSILAKSGDEHKRIRSVLYSNFFCPQALQKHLGKVSSVIERHLDKKWKGIGHDEVKVVPLVRDLVFNISCKLFFSTEDKHIREQLSESLEQIIMGSFSVPINMPGTRFRTAKLARWKMDQLIRSLMEKRRNDLQKQGNEIVCSNEDFLSVLLTAKDESGEQFSDKEIVDNISLFLHAAYDTTVSALVMFLKLLSSNPASFEEISKEQMQILSSKHEGEEMTWKDTKKMKYTWQVAQETMRMITPLFGAFRRAVADIEYDGYTIPKGWKLLWTVHTTHMKPQYFSEPEKFKPERFDEEEFVEPFTFLPFGGGVRTCPGWELAKMEMLLLMHHFVKAFSGFVAADPDEKITMDPFPLPVNGFSIKLNTKQQIPRPRRWLPFPDRPPSLDGLSLSATPSPVGNPPPPASASFPDNFPRAQPSPALPSPPVSATLCLALPCPLPLTRTRATPTLPRFLPRGPPSTFDTCPHSRERVQGLNEGMHALITSYTLSQGREGRREGPHRHPITSPVGGPFLIRKTHVQPPSGGGGADMDFSLAQYFSELEKFKPERFDEEEFVELFTFLPFGGGVRTCLGWELAKMEILLLMHHFMKAFSGFVAADPEEKITMDPFPLLVNGFSIKLILKS